MSSGQYRGGGYPVTASGKQHWSTGMSHMQHYSPLHTFKCVCVCVTVAVQWCVCATVCSSKCVHLHSRCVFACMSLTLPEVNEHSRHS